MPKPSPHSLEKRKRAVAAYRQIIAEAVSANCGYGAHLKPTPHPEIKVLAEGYGVTSQTLKNWSKKLL